MIDRNQAFEWIERKIDGEEIPPDVYDFIQQSPECLEYQTTLENAVLALDALPFPGLPENLVDGIMDYIRQQDEESASPQRATDFLSTWRKNLKRFWASVQIPAVLHREAVPVIAVACVIFVGIFTPRVEAQKSSCFFDSPMGQKVSTYVDWMARESDRIYDYANQNFGGLVGQVSGAFENGDLQNVNNPEASPPE